MNIRLHYVAEGRIYHTVALDSALAGKGIRHDPDLEVALTIAGTGVACVQVTLVLDQDVRRRKGRLQQFPDSLLAFRRHGNTSLNGLTTTW